MIVILNILLALLAFFVVRWLATECSVPHPINAILGVIAAVLVFVANLGARIV